MSCPTTPYYSQLLFTSCGLGCLYNVLCISVQYGIHRGLHPHEDGIMVESSSSLLSTNFLSPSSRFLLFFDAGGQPKGSSLKFRAISHPRANELSLWPVKSIGSRRRRGSLHPSALLLPAGVNAAVALAEPGLYQVAVAARYILLSPLSSSRFHPSSHFLLYLSSDPLSTY
ncbi:hypothetical protein BP00DRAFT_72671 [Aspergillus indologenus CBS 114.80]|uniref:Uncharacterized protein n=1 Tax=Aspergillus indologenus CBS 114.80 TaxID=1450541 RepID=A0A2V5HNS6_9EURO|nr:hypothetical protein BP00DRAFT_72671 [Aspergillus indologenus CBS 114.80]